MRRPTRGRGELPLALRVSEEHPLTSAYILENGADPPTNPLSLRNIVAEPTARRKLLDERQEWEVD
jgi:hypothetical protein